MYCTNENAKKYLTQINELYEDNTHICFMPLLDEEVRGLPALKDFAAKLLVGNPMPIIPELPPASNSSTSSTSSTSTNSDKGVKKKKKVTAKKKKKGDSVKGQES